MKNIYENINVSNTIKAVIERAYRLNTNESDSDSLKAIKVLNVLKSKRNQKSPVIKATYMDAVNQMQAIYNQL